MIFFFGNESIFSHQENGYDITYSKLSILYILNLIEIRQLYLEFSCFEIGVFLIYLILSLRIFEYPSIFMYPRAFARADHDYANFDTTTGDNDLDFTTDWERSSVSSSNVAYVVRTTLTIIVALYDVDCYPLRILNVIIDDERDTYVNSPKRYISVCEKFRYVWRSRKSAHWIHWIKE